MLLDVCREEKDIFLLQYYAGFTKTWLWVYAKSMLTANLKFLLLPAPNRNIDFAKFTYSKKYIFSGQEFKLFFDFDLKYLTGHNKKTFEDCRSLLYYLKNHPDKAIYLTESLVPDSIESGDKLIINIRAYQAFCAEIGRNGKERTQAFLSQKIKRYTEDEKRKILSGSTEEEILEVINSYTGQQKNNFLEKLKKSDPISTTEDRNQAIANDLQNLEPAIRDTIIKSLPEFREGNQSIIVTNENKKQIFEQILKADYSAEFWQSLTSANPPLAEQLVAGQVQVQRQKVIDEFHERLKRDYPETKGDSSWQGWIYKHNWLFGVHYEKPIEKQKINIQGIMPDFLFPTLDGFTDVLEIKLPSEEVIVEDSGHPGSWVWSSATNYAIGQVVNYLCEIEKLRYVIEEAIEKIYGKRISMLKPRAFILIGQSEGWGKEKKEALKKLNYALHGIEVITYTDLGKRGEAFLKSE